MATKPKPTKETQYIGVSIQEFLEVTGKEVAEGRFQDGTTIDPKVRAMLTQVTETLGDEQLTISYYVFVFSRFVFFKVKVTV